MARISARRLALKAAAFRRRGRGCLPALLQALILLFTAMTFDTAHAQAVKGSAALAASGGFARLLVKLDEDVESDVSVAGSILLIRFKRPVDISVEKLADAVPDYVNSARRDPDGMAIRLALNRKVTVNAMLAGERTFVDLLPESWVGLPPGLPQQVVRELAERARVAERALRQQTAESATRKRAALRLRASVQPTFVRLSAELPDGVGVSSALTDRKLVLSFNAPLTIDVTDALLAAPANIGAITQRSDGDGTALEIGLIGDVDIKPFREDKTYNVDVGVQPAAKSPDLKPAAGDKPVTAPVAGVVAAAPGDMAQAHPTLDSIAQLVSQDGKSNLKNGRKAEVKPDDVPKPAAVAVAPAATTVAPAVEAGPAPVAQQRSETVVARRGSDGLHLDFAFAAPTPAALFRRADVMWLVFDSEATLDLAPIRREGGALIGDVSIVKLPLGQAIRLRLNRPQLASLTSGNDKDAGKNWTLVFADAAHSAPQALTLVRNVADPAHGNATIPLLHAGRLHRIVDPAAGDALSVVTALPPARGFVRRQDFVEFSVFESGHGIVVQPNADDIAIDVNGSGVVLTRPGGLTLSASINGRERASSAAQSTFDLRKWNENVQAPFVARRDALLRALASASPADRMAARGDLARFYFARAMYPEAHAVLDVMIGEPASAEEDPRTLVMFAAASALMGRPEQALKTLANPALGANSQPQVWAGLALSQQGKWAKAREKFKDAGFAVGSLPPDLQATLLIQAMRANLEVKDYAGAAARGNELDVIGVAPELTPAVSVLRGRLAEALGRDQDALDDYRAAAASIGGPAAAEGRLLAVALRQKRDEISPEEALRELETLSVMWRGDGLEVKTLQMLAKIYAADRRYAEALNSARIASGLDGNSDGARQLQDDAAALFSEIYLTPKGDDMAPIAALALFYENRDLTPIGRRGDEMIRRLADRLVAVDLLDQASELLQYQIDNRIEGAARAQVAARLATIYIMNRKPDRAISALHATRIANLAGELRQQRLLLEARAQSDIGRRDLALDIISNIAGREAVRLRSDIYWSARRWREASEQIELYYGERWRDFTPLNAIEKSDVIRAVIGYALAEDALGLARFREKFAPLMGAAADRLAFDAASEPASTNSAEFGQIAKMAAGVDTLDGFLREMNSRFPDATARARLSPEPKDDPAATGALPQITGLKQAEAIR